MLGRCTKKSTAWSCATTNRGQGNPVRLLPALDGVAWNAFPFKEGELSTRRRSTRRNGHSNSTERWQGGSTKPSSKTAYALRRSGQELQLIPAPNTTAS